MSRRLLTGLAVTAFALTSAFGATSTATAAPTGDPQFKCGFVSCSYVFTRKTTNDIAGQKLTGGACKLIPVAPGRIACVAGFASVVVTAKIAKKQNKCLKINWSKTPPPPTGPWWPSTDDSSRCR